MTKSYQELGRELDEAMQTYARARDWVLNLGSPEAAAAAIEVTIRNAGWEDGTHYLQGALTAIVRMEIESLLPRALANLEQEAARANAVMVDAFQRLQVGAATVAPPVVPRQEAPLPDDAQPLGEASGDAQRVWRALTPPAREMLIHILGNPGQRLAKSAPRDELVAAGLAISAGVNPQQVWSLTDFGQDVADAG